MKDRLVDALKGAVELNLRYSSVVLNLSKEYIKDFERLVRSDVKQPAEAKAAEAKPAANRRAPILLVGELNEVVTGAFVLNNTAETDLNVSLVVQGELDASKVEITPATLVLSRGASAFVRLKVKLTEAMQQNQDYFGAVLVPGLSNEAIEFIVRRLPGPAAGNAPKRKHAAVRKATA